MTNAPKKKCYLNEAERNALRSKIAEGKPSQEKMARAVEDGLYRHKNGGMSLYDKNGEFNPDTEQMAFWIFMIVMPTFAINHFFF
jgi:peptide methionine sulfoxide reductase MsrB